MRLCKWNYFPWRQTCLFILIGILIFPELAKGEKIGTLDEFDNQVKSWAGECKHAVITIFDDLLQSGTLTENQLFDTFYIPIPNSDPPKYHTQYDRILEKVLKKILDSYLAKHDSLIYVVAVDVNGYVPTHNSRYFQPLSGNPQEDLMDSRSKRMFNDVTGLAAARSLQPFLLQRYSRDTGEVMYDMSLPIFIRDRHWGAIRIGYRHP
jgi:methyl-accepting chemotaxis protein